MQVMTVCGAVDAERLGVILAHEHLFLDLRNQFTEFTDRERQRLSHQPLSLANLGVVRRNPYAIRDNLLLDDIDVAVREAADFKALGGTTVVDCTSIGIQREPRRLRSLAERTGLNVIAGCGYYTQDTHPAAMAAWSAEQIAADMVRDLTVGIDGTGIRAGIIGEIGTSREIHPWEEKNLRAAALAFRETGVAVYVHTYPWGEAGLAAARLLIDAGVPPSKIVICHIDVAIRLEYIRQLLETGVFIEFDDFGKEFSIDPVDRVGFAGGEFARDLDRVRAIKELVGLGYEQQILVTNDICLKSMLQAYGGWGYGHILRHIIPMMHHEGIPATTTHLFLCENPRRLLDPVVGGTASARSARGVRGG